MENFKLFDFILNEELLDRYQIKFKDCQGNYLSEEQIIDNIKYAYKYHINKELKTSFLILLVKSFSHNDLKRLIED